MNARTTLLPFRELDKYFIGFDAFADRLNQVRDDITKSFPTYPPFNIVKVNDNSYVIEVAVAGFTKQEIDVELEGDKLVISGKLSRNDSSDDELSYIHRGLAFRPFTRTFLLNDKIEVRNAELFNGVLRVTLENIVQTSQKIKVAVADLNDDVRQAFGGKSK